LSVSDKRCIFDVSTKLNKISYTLPSIKALKQLKGNVRPAPVVEAGEGD